MLATYHKLGHLDEADRLAWVPPILSAHEQIIAPGELIAFNGDKRPVVEPPRMIARIIEAGKAFEVNEQEDPHLSAFIRGDERFQVLGRRRGRTFGTRAGSGI